MSRKLLQFCSNFHQKLQAKIKGIIPDKHISSYYPIGRNGRNDHINVISKSRRTQNVKLTFEDIFLS